MPFIPELEGPQIVMPPIQDIQLQQIQILQPTPPPVATPGPPILDDEPMKLDSLQLDTQFFTAEPLNSQFKAYKCKEIDLENVPAYDNLSNMVFYTDLWPD